MTHNADSLLASLMPLFGRLVFSLLLSRGASGLPPMTTSHFWRPPVYILYKKSLLNALKHPFSHPHLSQFSLVRRKSNQSICLAKGGHPKMDVRPLEFVLRTS